VSGHLLYDQSGAKGSTPASSKDTKILQSTGGNGESSQLEVEGTRGEGEGRWDKSSCKFPLLDTPLWRQEGIHSGKRWKKLEKA